MFKNQFKSSKSVALIVVLLSMFMFLAYGLDDVKASVVEKLTHLKLYSDQNSPDAAFVSGFDAGGFPGLIISASEVYVGDSLYVGAPGYSSRVLTEADIEVIKLQLYDQIYNELKESACLR